MSAIKNNMYIAHKYVVVQSLRRLLVCVCSCSWIIWGTRARVVKQNAKPSNVRYHVFATLSLFYHTLHFSVQEPFAKVYAEKARLHSSLTNSQRMTMPPGGRKKEFERGLGYDLEKFGGRVRLSFCQIWVYNKVRLNINLFFYEVILKDDLTSYFSIW